MKLPLERIQTDAAEIANLDDSRLVLAPTAREIANHVLTLIEEVKRLRGDHLTFTDIFGHLLLSAPSRQVIDEVMAGQTDVPLMELKARFALLMQGAAALKGMADYHISLLKREQKEGSDIASERLVRVRKMYNEATAKINAALGDLVL